MNTSEMLCPICKLPLVSIESFCYEDCMQYSNYSEKWICATPGCVCHTQNSYWNDDGDFFSGDMSNSYEIFPDHKYAALNSFAKKCEIEIYGYGLKRKIYLSPILTFGWLKPMIEIKYKGNEMGEVLGKSYKLHFLKKDGDRGYCTYYTSPISMLYLRLKNFKHKLKDHKRTTLYTIKELSKEYKRNGWNNDWHYKLFHWFIETIYYKTYDEVANYNTYECYISKYRGVEITSEQYIHLKKLCPNYIDFLSEIKYYNLKGDFLKQVIREAKLERIMND